MPVSFNSPDVRQLRSAELPRGAFPASCEADFRVYLAPSVHDGIWAHARERTDVEVGGVLAGQWQQDEDGPYVAVEAFIRCDTAVSKEAELTFTHETWTHIHEQMDDRYQNLKIVGWYHTHPDFGIFLSDRDCFINQHFFAEPGQIAYVVDPVKKTEGIFIWQDGKPSLSELYWAGNRIVAHAEQPANDGAVRVRFPDNPAAAAGESVESSERSGRINWWPVLGCMALFLLGYLLANVKTNWERQRLVEGTVAHYGVWKGLRPGLGDRLRKERNEVAAIYDKLRTLPVAESDPPTDGDKGADSKKPTPTQERTALARRLQRLHRHLGEIEDIYALSEEEAVVVAQIVADKMAELKQVRRVPAAKKPAAKNPASSPNASGDDASANSPSKAGRAADGKGAP